MNKLRAIAAAVAIAAVLAIPASASAATAKYTCTRTYAYTAGPSFTVSFPSQANDNFVNVSPSVTVTQTCVKNHR